MNVFTLFSIHVFIMDTFLKHLFVNRRLSHRRADCHRIKLSAQQGAYHILNSVNCRVCRFTSVTEAFAGSLGNSSFFHITLSPVRRIYLSVQSNAAVI